MSGEMVSQEEMLDALEETAAAALEVYRALVDCVTFQGVIDDPQAKAMVDERREDLKRWYSVLVRSGRDIGDIPELATIGS